MVRDRTTRRSRRRPADRLPGATGRPFAAGLLVTAAVVLAGCGGGTSLLSHTAASGSRTTGPGAHAPSPTGRGSNATAGAGAAAIRVIRGWADQLRAGHVVGAARYFHLPSLFVDGPGAAIEIHDLRQAVAANEALPCGARLISASRRGRYVNARFRLTERTGRGGGPNACGSGTGQTASTNFLIVHGRIVEWLRAPSQPGGQSPPQTPTPSGPTPVV